MDGPAGVCGDWFQGFVLEDSSFGRPIIGPRESCGAAPALFGTDTKSESRTVLPSDVGLLPLPIDTGCDDPLLFQLLGQSSPGLLADVEFLEGSASTLCSGVCSFVATAG
jgi:hypothetical protein